MKAKRRRYVPVKFDDFVKNESKRKGKTETDVMLEIVKNKKKNQRVIFKWDFKV